MGPMDRRILSLAKRGPMLRHAGRVMCGLLHAQGARLPAAIAVAALARAAARARAPTAARARAAARVRARAAGRARARLRLPGKQERQTI